MADTNTPSLSSARLAAIECQRKAALSCGYTSVDFPRLSAPLLNVDIPDLLASHYALSAQVEALTKERDAAISATADLIEAQRAEIERLTAAEADRDALLSALGFKGGPLGDDLRRKVILDDASALRPAMVKARRRADEAEAGAMLADGFVSERGGLLLRVWEMRAGERRKRREAEAALFDLDGGLIANTGDTAACLTHHAGRYDLDTETFVAQCVTGDVTHTLKAEGFDASEDGANRW